MIEQNKLTQTKKIAKHGNQAIIIVPKMLESRLQPGTLVQLEINVLEERR